MYTYVICSCYNGTGFAVSVNLASEVSVRKVEQACCCCNLIHRSGWEFSVEATYGGFGPVEKRYHMCRRRRWVRLRRLVKAVAVPTDQVILALHKFSSFVVASVNINLFCGN
jgi:hypothetical protein